MSGLHYQLKQRIKHGYVKLSELRPHSREIAERMIKNGEIYICSNGFLKLNIID